jgi:hypothetical protein
LPLARGERRAGKRSDDSYGFDVNGGQGTMRSLLNALRMNPWIIKVLTVERRSEVEEFRQEIRYGDLVRWDAEGKIHVGVVAAINTDGTCSIDYHGRSGPEILHIRTKRLERIVSTIEAGIPAAEPAPAPEKKAVPKEKKAARRAKGKAGRKAKGRGKKTTARKKTSRKKSMTKGKSAKKGRKRKA